VEISHGGKVDFPRAGGAETDAKLLGSFVCTGDRAAMDVLFSRHAEDACRLALRFLRNHCDAEDAVQTAFLDILTRAARHRRGRSVRSWIMGFVVNTCRNKLREERHRRERQKLVAGANAARGMSKDFEPDRECYQMALIEIEALPQHYREPMRLHFVEGLASCDVAAVLRQPAGTIRSRLSRGLSQLRGTRYAAVE
jgi:RNA polymerase sigma factor (sigma-70 family)